MEKKSWSYWIDMGVHIINKKSIFYLPAEHSIFIKWTFKQPDLFESVLSGHLDKNAMNKTNLEKEIKAWSSNLHLYLKAYNDFKIVGIK